MLPPMESTCRAISLRRAVLGPFARDHVLDEMRDTIPFGIFIARTGLQPDADRSGADVLHLLSDDGEPVGRLLPTNIATSLVIDFCIRYECLSVLAR